MLTGLSTYGTNVAANTNWFISQASSTAATLSFASSNNFTIAQESRVVSLATKAISGQTGTTSANVLSNSGTLAYGVLGTTGLLAGSFFTASGSSAVLANAGTSAAAIALSFTTGSVAAVTGVSTATAASTFATSGIPAFGYNGTFGMTTSSTQASYLSGPFSAGIMATGASLAGIDLRSTAVTVTGSLALVQPWFALAGS